MISCGLDTLWSNYGKALSTRTSLSEGKKKNHCVILQEIVQETKPRQIRIIYVKSYLGERKQDKLKVPVVILTTHTKGKKISLDITGKRNITTRNCFKIKTIEAYYLWRPNDHLDGTLLQRPPFITPPYNKHRGAKFMGESRFLWHYNYLFVLS